MPQGRVGVLGGGAVGLAVAFELARHDWEVVLIDRVSAVPNASWAGAGILLPANRRTATHPIDQLCALSNDLHWEWSQELLALTGVDNELRRCGGVYLARSMGERISLEGMFKNWQADQIASERLDAATLRGPSWRGRSEVDWADVALGVWLPDESQLRNPRHLEALRQACRQLGVTRIETANDPSWVRDQGRITDLEVDGRLHAIDAVVVCGGAYSGRIVDQLGLNYPLTPVRGQMLLYRFDRPPIDFVINEGPRYLVPRIDGHLLVGSTMEEVGFDHNTTEGELARLESFAQSWLRCCRERRPIASWAGLRPASYDGLPYIGQASQMKNVWIASGHFRVGLQTSTGTARLIREMLEGRPTTIDVSLFRPARVNLR